jgi:TonB family protein
MSAKKTFSNDLFSSLSGQSLQSRLLKRSLFLCLPAFAALAVFAQSAPKKVTIAEASAAVTTKVSPEYPALGKQLKIEGRVELEATVAENGSVETVTIVSGNPILTRPAADAIKKWKFVPFTDDGKPCKALAPVSITFKL